MNWIKAVALAAASLTVNGKKLFIDNDGSDFGAILYPLMAGIEIVGFSGVYGSASYVDAIGSMAEMMDDFNISSCIPLYGGASQPLIRTKETFKVWEDLYGALVWEGCWSDFYEDAYSWGNFTYNETLPGAMAMIEAVKKNKDTDPVIIYAAGTMTTVAQAISLYPDLVKDAAGLYIMGGYIDFQYARATGPSIQDDLYSDINLIQDPEAAQMVLTADWNYIYIGGNVTNKEIPSQELYDTLIERAGGMDVIETDPFYTVLLNKVLYTGNYTENNEQETLPFWDSVVAAYIAFPELVLQTTEVALAVDTSFASPSYGTAKIWSHDRSPKSLKTGNVTIVDVIDQESFYDILVDGFFKNFSDYCTTGQIFDVN